MTEWPTVESHVSEPVALEMLKEAICFSLFFPNLPTAVIKYSSQVICLVREEAEIRVQTTKKSIKDNYMFFSLLPAK